MKLKKTNKKQNPKNQSNKKPQKQQQIKKGERKSNESTHCQSWNSDSISILISWCEENCFKNFFLRDNPNQKLFYKVREV